ncbi:MULTISPECIES: tRNA lysidine(34) synthetase TilS [unclassified Phaeobacter]|uniref:tRNA lysidine(34) synthetase TilS n=1 Tax=unclassified Phaeobacter TaxID=2621772 RepID=UPI003A8C1AD7
MRRDRDILAIVQEQFRSALPERLGVAVSGGGDSMALMYALHECFADLGVEICVATVDHGLRASSGEEAQMVADVAAKLGLAHDILQWVDRPSAQQAGNLQEQARNARYTLLTAWAQLNDIPVVALGHTADDQAETLLMRLGRSSGVSGLAAMPRSRAIEGITLLRPLLEVTREELRGYLRERGGQWVEDPSNEDLRFERVRVRQAMDALAPLGLTVQRLAAVARNMGAAREALDWYTFLAARDMAEVRDGAIVIDQRQFRTLPDEIAHRLLVRSVQWVSGAVHPPRREPMVQAREAVRRGGSFTLGGCRMITRKQRTWVCREYNPVADEMTRPGRLWDGRWRVFGGEVKDHEVRALGSDGLQHCPDWRSAEVPGEVLHATPAVWRGGELVAAPLAEFGNGWSAELVQNSEEFFTALLSH